jgi:hypothetical protein
MHIIDDIAYADNTKPPIKVQSVRPLEKHKVWVKFATGETKVFDLSSLLSFPAFSPLIDSNIFGSVYIENGVVTWDGGKIDIAPEKLYLEGVDVKDGN